MTETMKVFANLTAKKVNTHTKIGNLDDIYVALEAYKNEKHDSKNDYPLFSVRDYAEYHDERRNEQIKGSRYYIVDVDCNEDTLEHQKALDEVFKAYFKPYKYITFATFNNNIKGYRHRFIFELEQEIGKEQYTDVTRFLNNLIINKVTKELQKKGIDVKIELDDAFTKLHQYTLFCPNDFKYHRGNTMPVKAVLNKLESNTPTHQESIVSDNYDDIDESISEKAYLDTVKETMTRTNLNDYKAYSSLEISIQSDLACGAITYGIAQKAVKLLAQGNSQWERDNVKRLNIQRKNPSSQVLSDRGLRCFVPNTSYSKSVTTKPFVNAITVTPCFKTNKETKQVTLTTMRANLDVRLLCAEYVATHNVLYAPNSKEKFFEFEDGYWQQLYPREALINYREWLVEKIKAGEYTVGTGVDGTIIDMSQINYPQKDALFKTQKFMFSKDLIEDCLQDACVSVGKYLGSNEVFYSRRNDYAQVFQNGTLYYDVKGNYEFKEDSYNKADYIYTKIPCRFMNDMTTLQANEGVQAFRGYLTALFDNKETSEKFCAYVGKMAFPKEKSAQIYALMKSRGGSGKSRIAEFVMDMIGAENSFRAMFNDFYNPNNRFSKQVSVGKLCGFFDEIEFTRTVEDTLKDETGTTIARPIEEKGKDPVMVPVTYNLLLATNKHVQFSDTGTSNLRRLKYFRIRKSFESLTFEQKQAFDFDTKIAPFKDEILSYCVLKYMEELKLRAKRRAEGFNESDIYFMASEKMIKDTKALFAEMSVFDEFVDTLCVRFDTKLQVGETVTSIYEAFSCFMKVNSYEYSTGITKKLLKNRLDEMDIEVIDSPRHSSTLANNLKELCKQTGYKSVFEDSMNQDFTRGKRFKGLFIDKEKWMNFLDEFPDAREFSYPKFAKDCVMMRGEDFDPIYPQASEQYMGDPDSFISYVDHPEFFEKFVETFVGFLLYNNEESVEPTKANFDALHYDFTTRAKLVLLMAKYTDNKEILENFLNCNPNDLQQDLDALLMQQEIEEEIDLDYLIPTENDGMKRGEVGND